MQSDPNATFESLKAKTWVFSGEHAVFFIPSTDSEAVHGIGQVITDLFHGTDGDYSTNGETTVFDVDNHYTQSVDDVNARLANAAEHYGVEGIVWVSSNVRAVRALSQGVTA